MMSPLRDPPDHGAVSSATMPAQILSCPEKPAFNTCGRKCPEHAEHGRHVRVTRRSDHLGAVAFIFVLFRRPAAPDTRPFNMKKPERPQRETFRSPIGIRADGMEGPTGASADQGCCRWPGPPGPPCPPPPGPGPGPHGPQQAPRAPSTSRTAPRRMTLRCRLLFMHFLQGMVKNQPTIFSGRTHSSNCASVTKPSARADAFSVVPSLCAFLAICAALS